MPAKKTHAKRSTTGHKPRTEREVRETAARAPARPADLEPSSLLAPGSRAPAFALRSTPDQTVSLTECLGRPVVLAFYPADWSPVCGDQLTLYNEVLSEFQRFGAELIGISVDGVWCHAAFAEQRHFHFPLLADFEPKGEVARKYGAFNAQAGLANRALFVIDRNGTIHWSYLSPMGVNPGADGILSALESLATTDGLHPDRSRPGEAKRELRVP
jgi:peroxiredoxin